LARGEEMLHALDWSLYSSVVPFARVPG
jgi:hypothetical protein